MVKFTTIILGFILTINLTAQNFKTYEIENFGITKFLVELIKLPENRVHTGHLHRQ